MYLSLPSDIDINRQSIQFSLSPSLCASVSPLAIVRWTCCPHYLGRSSRVRSIRSFSLTLFSPFSLSSFPYRDDCLISQLSRLAKSSIGRLESGGRGGDSVRELGLAVDLKPPNLGAVLAIFLERAYCKSN